MTQTGGPSDIVQRHAEIESGRLPEMLGVSIVERIHIERYRFAATVLRDGAVLDIASGIGYGTNMLSQEARVAHITGVDVSPEAIAKAKGSYSSAKLTFQLVDGKRLPFDDGSFDTVVSFETVEHTADRPAFLSELRRVLRDDGKLIISTPNKRYHSFGKPNPWNPFHTVEYYPEEFLALLKGTFRSVEFWGGQEFLDNNLKDLLRYNWTEFRYYNFDHHPVLAPLAEHLKQWKRAVAGPSRSSQAPPDPASVYRRAAVVPWVEGREPFTMVAVCAK